jgi:hypothetical protein
VAARSLTFLEGENLEATASLGAHRRRATGLRRREARRQGRGLNGCVLPRGPMQQEIRRAHCGSSRLRSKAPTAAPAPLCLRHPRQRLADGLLHPLSNPLLTFLLPPELGRNRNVIKQQRRQTCHFDNIVFPWPRCLASSRPLLRSSHHGSDSLSL